MLSMQGPSASAALELLKPITWFPPMWAYGCGVISSGVAFEGRALDIALGIALAGPLVCGTSQVVNDWFDRHVDAINEPQRPIPSGRAPGRSALYIGFSWTFLSLCIGALLGPVVLLATIFGLALAWAYSAPPFRLKQANGWAGITAVGLCYEGLPWLTGAAVMVAALPRLEILAAALLFSIGALGIMILNDFKALDGDRLHGVRSVPVLLGPARAARTACALMVAPQILVTVALFAIGRPLFALAVGAVVLTQFACMPRLLSDPRAHAPWYNGTGVSLFVSGMMVTAHALRDLP